MLGALAAALEPLEHALLLVLGDADARSSTANAIMPASRQTLTSTASPGVENPIAFDSRL